MAALVRTDHIGTVTWLGVVADRAAALRSSRVASVEIGFEGFVGEDHGGLTRPSCSRVLAQYPKGTQIRNTRQICIVSAEELARIALKMGVAHFDPAWCGAGMVIEGIPDLTHLPPASRLQINGATTLTVDMENLPCTLPAPVIEQDAPGFGKAFKPAAKGLRGVTAWVERPGMVAIGDQVVLHVPGQRAWMPEGAG